jgi:hypothetical protein
MATATSLPSLGKDPENPPKSLPKNTTSDYPTDSASAPKVRDANLPLAQPGGRKRRTTRRRGGFVLQNPNLKAGLPPTGAAGTLGGRRRTRKSKGKKRHTRRR